MFYAADEVFEDQDEDWVLAEQDEDCDWYAEAYQAQFDDDPSPYDGNYSEE